MSSDSIFPTNELAWLRIACRSFN